MKIRKRILSLALAGALALGLMPGMTMTALADGDTSYTLTIPSTLNVANSGWNDAGGISATGTLASGKKLTVTASSANSWALKSGENTIGYNLATATGTYSSSATPASWEFTELTNIATTKPMGIIVEDYSTKPAGTYSDTVTFTASVANAAKTVTWSFDSSSISGTAYNVTQNGVTLQGTILNENSAVSLTNLTFSVASGKITKIDALFYVNGNGWTTENTSIWTGNSTTVSADSMYVLDKPSTFTTLIIMIEE